MGKFNLEKRGNKFYLTLFARGLMTPSGNIELKTDRAYEVRKPSYSRPNYNLEDLVVVGNLIVYKKDLYDFLRDERKEDVPGPGGSKSFKFVKLPNGKLQKKEVLRL